LVVVGVIVGLIVFICLFAVGVVFGRKCCCPEKNKSRVTRLFVEKNSKIEKPEDPYKYFVNK
jgi:hypothetical protein